MYARQVENEIDFVKSSWTDVRIMQATGVK